MTALRHRNMGQMTYFGRRPLSTFYWQLEPVSLHWRLFPTCLWQASRPFGHRLLRATNALCSQTRALFLHLTLKVTNSLLHRSPAATNSISDGHEEEGFDLAILGTYGVLLFNDGSFADGTGYTQSRLSRMLFLILALLEYQIIWFKNWLNISSSPVDCTTLISRLLKWRLPR